MLRRMFIAAVALSCFSISLFAQKQTKDTIRTVRTPSVTVTSTRAIEGVNPVAFAEIDREEIEMTHTVADLPMFLNAMPSVHTYSQSGNGVGYSNLSMRGFDQRRISVLINGIPQNDPEDHNVYWIDFPDIQSNLENIQVQRGAGMMNYGAAAIGGSINLVTSNFVNNPGIKLYSGIGYQEYGSDAKNTQQSLSKFSMEASSGLVDGKYAFYGRLSRINSNGYRNHSWATLNSFFLSAARFDEHLTTQINIFGGPLSDALVYNGIPKAHIEDKDLRLKNYSWWNYDSTGTAVQWPTDRSKQDVETFTQPHYEVLNDWQITDNLSLKSSLFYYTGDGQFDELSTWMSDLSYFNFNEANGYENEEVPQNPIARWYVGNRHGGWIPRLIWNHDNHQFTFGAEFRRHRSDHWMKILFAENLPSGFDPDYKVYQYEGVRDIMSAFFREQYKADEDLLLSAEAQFVHNKYAIENEKFGGVYSTYLDKDGNVVGNGDRLFDVNYFFVNPRIGATWNVDEHQTIFGSVSYTTREPRMKNLYDASSSFSGSHPLFEATSDETNVYYDFDNPLVKPEKMLDIELGMSYRSENMHFSINGYWMEYYDELVKTGELDIFGLPVDGNAPRTRHAGIEIQGSYLIKEDIPGSLKPYANATFSKNEILEWDYLANNGETASLEGNDIAGFPSFMANFGFIYEYQNLYFNLSGRYLGDSKTDNYGDMLTTDEVIMTDLKDSGEFYTDNTLDAFMVFNLDVAYTFEDILGAESFKIHAQVINLFNKLYAAGAEGRFFFPAAERSIFIGFQLGM